MKTKIKARIEHNPSSILGRPYKLSSLVGAVTVTVNGGTKIRTGDLLDEATVESLSGDRDVEVTVFAK